MADKTLGKLSELRAKQASMRERLAARRKHGRSGSAATSAAAPAATAVAAKEIEKASGLISKETEDKLRQFLFTAPTPDLPCGISTVLSQLETAENVSTSDLELLLRKYAAEGLLGLSQDQEKKLVIIQISPSSDTSTSPVQPPPSKRRLLNPPTAADDLEAILATSSHKEAKSKKMGAEILDILNAPSAMERSVVKKFQSVGGQSVQEFCKHNTAKDCMAARKTTRQCDLLHFRRVIKPHTEESLGDCSYLNNCFHMDTCKFIHYVVDEDDERRLKREGAHKNGTKSVMGDAIQTDIDSTDLRTYPAQWVQCDVRKLDLSTLGKFSVIMADPPWDIHMELPYGTMEDEQMRHLRIPELQDDGFIFLWVTGRAMELGRECLRLWGYKRCDELIWVKTNQLQKLIRTGRTGHWMNHAKEHCLVGAKGDISKFNCGLDCDVLVGEVRETSHKPDEIYGVIERLAPGSRKLEIFGRQHNVQKNWVTLGNQLDGIRLVDPDMVERFREAYPYNMKTTLQILLTGVLPAPPALTSAPTTKGAPIVAGKATDDGEEDRRQ